MPAVTHVTFRDSDTSAYTYSGTDANTYTIWTNWADSATNAFNELGSAVGNLTGTVDDLNRTVGTWMVWTGGDLVIGQQVQSQPIPLTPEQEARRAVAQEQARLAEEQRQRDVQEKRRQRELATARAKALLLENLTTEQAEEYLRDEAFHIMAANGKRYQLTRAYSGNIHEVDDAGKIVRGYCVHVECGVDAPPVEDNLLAQVLFLRTLPQILLDRANPAH